MERPLQHDSHDCIEGVRRKLFRARDEIAGRVVDQRIDALEFLFGGRNRAFDRGEIANVTGHISGARFFHANFLAGARQRLFAAAEKK